VRRSSPRALQLASAVALAQLAASMVVLDEHGLVLWRALALHAAWAGFALGGRRVVAGHVGAACLALLVLTPEADIGRAVATVPTLALLAGLATVLRERLERGEARLRALVVQDPLTGVANRRGFDARLQSALAGRAPADPLGLVLLDLDGFKAVNDQQGHLRGDALLRDAAGALRSVVRPGDLVSRHGGDEFALLLEGAGPQRTAAVAARVEEALAGAGLSASVGSSVFPRDGAEPLRLLALADAQQRAAKGARRRNAVG